MRIPHYIKSITFLLFLTFIAGCTKDQKPDAQQLVNESIEAHGGKKFDQMAVSFKFRDKQYRALRDNGAFVYSRSFTDSTGQQVHDVLRNSGFEREINGTPVELNEKKTAAYSASVNSVIYFALLPYFLNDDAVLKQYLGETVLKGEPYHMVKVTFEQEGGGDGFKDEYVYWLHKKNKTMDYLAYSFQENGGGTRFREATNARDIKGLRFQDYNNYTASENVPMERYGELFEEGKLEKVSEINLEEVKVSDLPQK